MTGRMRGRMDRRLQFWGWQSKVAIVVGEWGRRQLAKASAALWVDYGGRTNKLLDGLNSCKLCEESHISNFLTYMILLLDLLRKCRIIKNESYQLAQIQNGSPSKDII